jgi:hypothetical protein
MWLVYVDLPRNPSACFAFIVNAEGVVAEAAPIARWAIGKRGRQVVIYYKGRQARVEIRPIKEQV